MLRPRNFSILSMDVDEQATRCVVALVSLAPRFDIFYGDIERGHVHGRIGIYFVYLDVIFAGLRERGEGDSGLPDPGFGLIERVFVGPVLH